MGLGSRRAGPAVPRGDAHRRRTTVHGSAAAVVLVRDGATTTSAPFVAAAAVVLTTAELARPVWPSTLSPRAAIPLGPSQGAAGDESSASAAVRRPKLFTKNTKKNRLISAATPPPSSRFSVDSFVVCAILLSVQTQCTQRNVKIKKKKEKDRPHALSSVDQMTIYARSLRCRVQISCVYMTMRLLVYLLRPVILTRVHRLTDGLNFTYDLFTYSSTVLFTPLNSCVGWILKINPFWFVYNFRIPRSVTYYNPLVTRIMRIANEDLYFYLSKPSRIVVMCKLISVFENILLRSQPVFK